MVSLLPLVLAALAAPGAAPLDAAATPDPAECERACEVDGDAHACACRASFSLEHADVQGAVDYYDMACTRHDEPSCITARAGHAELTGSLSGRALVDAYDQACVAQVQAACTRARALTVRARANGLRWRLAYVAAGIVGMLLAIGLGRVLAQRRRARARRPRQVAAPPE